MPETSQNTLNLTPNKLQTLLALAFQKRRKVLVKGKPGIGKTDVLKAAAKLADCDLVMMHPAISDPTDFKGMPTSLPDGTAHFLPFGTQACPAGLSNTDQR